MRVRKIQLLVIASALPLAVAVFFGFKVFELWSQITYIWAGRQTPFALLAEGSPHALRYTLVYPILIFSENFGLNHDDVFTQVVLACLILTNMCIAKTAEILGGRSMSISILLFVVVIPMNLLFFMINGRGAFALCGYSICLTVFMHFIHGGRLSAFNLISLFLGFIMCGVSTGILASAYASAVIAAWIIGYRMVVAGSTWRGIAGLFSILLLLIAFFGFFAGGVRKNIAFFGANLEGVKDLISHGMGRFLVAFVDVPFLSLLALFAIGLIGLAYIQSLRNTALVAFILSSLACGLFGYSTLAIALVPILVYVLLIASRVKFRTSTDTMRNRGSHLSVTTFNNSP